MRGHYLRSKVYRPPFCGFSEWGSEIEMLTFAHLTNTNVYSYCTVYTPADVDRSLDGDHVTRSVYIKNSYNVHFEVVLSTCTYQCICGIYAIKVNMSYLSVIPKFYYSTSMNGCAHNMQCSQNVQG